MNLLILVSFSLLFYSFGAPPAGRYQGQEKNIIDNNAVLGECQFADYDKNEKVKNYFPEYSKSKIQCGAKMYNLGKILTYIKPDATRPLYGANNVVDLLFSRIGNYDVKWDGDETSIGLDHAICENHFHELYWKWNFYHMKHSKAGGKKHEVCSYPTEKDFPADSKAVHYRLSKNDAQLIWSKKGGIFLQPGLGVCQEHQQMIMGLIESKKESEIDPPFCPEPMEIDNEFEDNWPGDCVPPNKPIPKDIAAFSKVQDFADSFDMKRFVTSVSYESLKRETVMKKRTAAKSLFMKIAEAVAPYNEKQFLEAVCGKFDRPGADEWKTKLLQNVADQYEKAVDDKMLKLYALSTVTHLVSYGEVLNYLPNLTYYYYHEAKKLQKAAKLPFPDERQIYIRYDPKKIEKFIDFVTSPFCLITLPYGQQKVKLSDGTKIDIPHTMRLQRHSELIRMFKGKLTEQGQQDMLLPDSTMYGILKNCYARQPKNIVCVDYFVAAGLEAFTSLNEIIDEWTVQQEIDSDGASDLKKSLKKGEQYLRTDFKVDLQMHSPVIEHCLRHALSDPTTPAFRATCDEDEKHVTLGERDEELKRVLLEIKEIAEDYADKIDKESDANEYELRQRQLYTVKEAILDIEDMKAHIVRARYSDIQRSKIIEGLSEGEVFITLDWAQKLLAQRRLETQRTYFGKRGMSYHISHVMTKIDGNPYDHSFVHIIKGAKQDHNAVSAILLDVLTNLKSVGITSAIIRSDNAGCYKSAPLMFSLKQLSEESGVQISRWSFSEAQNGKSSCDQKASQVKSKVRYYVRQKRKVEDEDEFFTALTDPVMGKTTVPLSNVQLPENAEKAKTLPGIMSFSDFLPEPNGIRVYKFMDIGTGKQFMYSKKSYAPLNKIPKLQHEKQRNVLYDSASVVTTETEKAAIDAGEETQFWRLMKGRKHKHSHSFHCPETQCTESFETVGELDEHLALGIHKFHPERMGSMDYAVSYYRENVLSAGLEESEETIRNFVAKEMLNSNLDSVKEGWAHKHPREFPKITAAAKEFLKKLFDEGETSKVKKTPQQARKLMSAAKIEDEFQFKADEVLTVNQIKSQFALMAKEKDKCDDPASHPPAKKRCPIPPTEEESLDFEDDESETEVNELDSDINDSENQAAVANDKRLRRSSRIIEAQNAKIRAAHEEKIETMVMDALDPNENEKK